MYQLAFLHWCVCVSHERMPLSICYWCFKFRHTVHLIACMFLFSFIFWFEPALLLVLASYCHYQDFNTIQIRLHVHAFLSLIKLYEHCSSNLTFKNFMKIILTSCWRVVTCGVTCTVTLFTFHFIGKGMFL